MHRLLALLAAGSLAVQAADRPNILWLTSEDNGPHYGCYGDTYASTPNLDALAARGLRFQHCWSNAPVCAPARTVLISGRWAPADGAEHMRSQVPLPRGHQMYPQLLRAAGYYCTNNSKEDYNLDKPGDRGADAVWHESSGRAHWKNRAPGQPFFAVFNSTLTHESQIRRRPHTLSHDPAKAPLPPFHPDTPEVRHDWAQYHDNVTLMDAWVGRQLAELEKAGLAEDTIVMHYGDHGPGMPFFKRWPHNRGLRVGLILHFPKKWQHLAPKGYAAGAASDELVSFLDLPATVLSLAGVRPPEYFHGRALGGPFAAAAPAFSHGFRGRMDERYDLVRSTTDGRYVYLRNYLPQLPYGQFLDYMFQQATTRVWKDRFDAGTLQELQTRFWKPKPSEELYDLEADPWETVNLADSTAHAEVKQRLSSAQRRWLLQTRDLGFIPEAERLAVAGTGSPKDAFAGTAAYPMEAVLDAAEVATDRNQTDPAPLAARLDHGHAAVRYWGVLGYLIRGETAIRTNAPALEKLLADPSPSVRIAAAETLVSVAKSPAVLERGARVLLASAGGPERPYFETLEALNAIDRQLARLQPWRAEIAALPDQAPASVPKRLKEYFARLRERLELEPARQP